MKQDTQNQTEKAVAGAGYILSFAKNVHDLTENYSNYVCIVIELESKYGDKVDTMQEHERIAMAQYTQALRKSISMVYVGCMSLSKYIEKDTKKMKKTYEEIGKDFAISREKALSFVQEANNFLVNNTLRRLLETSEDFVTGVVSNV
jgi:hypothetical protein